MIRALVSGDRRASLGALFGLFGLAAVLVSSLSLTLDYRSQLISVKSTIYTRCLQRQAYDQSAHEAAAADIQLYQTLLQLLDEQPAPTTVQGERVSEQYRAAIQLDLQRKQAAVSAGVIGACKVYR
jgi:hypothetical protein